MRPARASSRVAGGPEVTRRARICGIIDSSIPIPPKRELAMQPRFFERLRACARLALPVIFSLIGMVQGSTVVAGTGERVATSSPDAAVSRAAVDALATYLSTPADERPELAGQPFAATPLSREDAARAQQLMWQDHVARIRQTRTAEMDARELTAGELKMPFYYEVFGDKPAGGRSMFISMHGGGEAQERVNDRQWENQKKLYRLEEGVYVVPRAPTNTWNLWHQAHIDQFFGRLIEDLIVFEDVDPDRVYLMGYSAGGDGVFQLAPRMADRLAAAAMMAGHPNETSPIGLRNLPFTMHVGGLDSAYNRNEVARQWEKQLDELHESDPEGYVHWVKIYPDKSHWMDREDAAAIPWMAKYRRNLLPTRVVWKQDDVVHARFYWLAADPQNIEGRAEVTAVREGQKIDIQATGVKRLTILLNDDMANLDQPMTATSQGQTVFEGSVTRTIAVMAKTLQQRGDPKDVFSGEVTVNLTGEAGK